MGIRSWAAFGAVAVALLTGPTVPSQAQQAPVNLALNKPTIASAVENSAPATAGPQLAVDGDVNTRWAAGAAGEQWWAVDLGSAQPVGSVRITWEAAYAVEYDIAVSSSALPTDPADFDSSTFNTVATVTTGKGGTETVSLPAGTTGRSVAIFLHTPGPFQTYSFWEFRVFAEHGGTLTGTVTGPSGAVAGAVVKVSGQDTAQTTTDATGQYTLTGLYAGSYTLTAYQPGQLAPVTQNVTLIEGQTTTQPITLTQPVVLTPFAFPYYTADWMAQPDTANDYSTSIFDTAFDVTTLPTDNPATLNGVPFKLGPSTAGANNVVAVSGSTFLVPQGNYSAIHTLASASGAYDGTVTLSYADGSTDSVPFRVSDWFGAPANGEIIGIPVTHRLDANGVVQNEGSAINIFQFYIPANPAKTLVSVSFSAPASTSATTTKPYLFAMTLESLAALPATGTVNGTVTGNGAALAGATVRVGPYTTATDAGGKFSLSNLAAGTYTVIAFKTGQFAPVSQSVTLAAGGTGTATINLTVTPTFVQYPLFYTNDWASTHENPGDYFAADTAYPAAGDANTPAGHGLPDAGAFTPQGMSVIFNFPTTNVDYAKNVALIDGQTMPVAPAHYSALYLLESGGWSGVSGPLTLTYADGTSETVNATFTDWFGNPSATEQVAWAVDHRHSPTDPNNALSADPANPTQIKIFAETLPVNYNKVLKSITWFKDPLGYTNQTGFLWAMTLEAVDAPQTGTVTGTVKGAGGPVQNAVVSLGGFGQVTTDASGNFTINNAPVGTYNLQVLTPGDSNLAGASVPVTVAQGQSVNANLPTIAAGPTQVFSSLGDSNYEIGLTQLEDDARVTNSTTTVTQAGGQTGRQIPAGGRMYFNVNDSFLYNNTTLFPVYVQVTYFDKETQTNPTTPTALALHYNSSDETVGDYDPRYAKTTTDTTVQTGDTGTWKSVVFELPDAGFYNTLELGGDFYLEAQNGPVVVQSVVVSKSQTITPIPPPPAQKLGDVNNDTLVNVTDAVLVLRAAVGLQTLTAAQTTAADVNKDNAVNVTDAVKILRVAVGVDPGF